MKIELTENGGLWGILGGELRSQDHNLPDTTRAKKGDVTTQVVKGRLRLCWSYQGNRTYLSLGLSDSKINRSAAALIASRIEEDIRTQNFDSTLTKYRTVPKQSIALVMLFDRYWADKRDGLQLQTNQKYSALRNQLSEFFERVSAEIEPREAQAFVNHLATQQKPTTIRDRVSILKACWNWGQQQKLVSDNSWDGVTIAKSTSVKPKPFNKVEVTKILEFFRSHPGFDYYSDLVEFKLRTGCRTGEATGLCWKHLNADCSEIDIIESVTKGDRKPTKTGEARSFHLSAIVQRLLLNRKPENASANDLVFPAPKGNAINGENFAKRYWKPALETLDIPYRKPYNTRSTFASHALESGLTPSEVCEITGHSQETLFRNYAGSIKRSTLPDLW